MSLYTKTLTKDLSVVKYTSTGIYTIQYSSPKVFYKLYYPGDIYFHKNIQSTGIGPVTNLLHRLDGPAFIRLKDIQEFWIEGNRYTSELEYWIAVEKYKKENGIE